MNILSCYNWILKSLKFLGMLSSNYLGRNMYSVGSASDYGAQMVSHDFIKRLTRELVFNLDGQRVYGTTFSNWVMLMSLHKCARIM
ncbi:hypothetical protein ACN38_g665 [Penicillium nordicum]|uniref:Uncharacterized protein n=1 Tax=Penicillium nordicum TaxID=229535 RepID=A0A0M8PHN9_9EURO|nr:hypothetical protein ACN38_g665 [Penicillium nordicum]